MIEYFSNNIIEYIFNYFNDRISLTSSLVNTNTDRRVKQGASIASTCHVNLD